MKVLSYKPQSVKNPQGKQKVYFCAHPDDYLLLDEIGKEILSRQSCCVWYDSDPTAECDIQELLSLLSGMQLFAVPVTTKLLTQSNRAMDAEIKFAFEKMIPVLPIMLEEGLEVKSLYIDLYPYTAAADPWLSDTKLLLDTDLDFKLRAWELMRRSSGASFSDFYEFFVTANNEQLLTYPVNNALVSSQFRNGGTLLEQAGKTREELYALGTLGSRDGLNEAQVEGYRRLAALAEEYDLNLYFLETPKYERMYADEDYLELYGLCLETVRGLEKEWNGKGSFRIICAEDLDFDSSDAGNFQDLIHLSAAGRTEYTRLLCGAVKSEE